MRTRASLRVLAPALLAALLAARSAATWTCDEARRGSGDGCDCGCGERDPDCGQDDAPLLDRCHEKDGTVFEPVSKDWTCTAENECGSPVPDCAAIHRKDGDGMLPCGDCYDGHVSSSAQGACRLQGGIHFVETETDMLDELQRQAIYGYYFSNKDEDYGISIDLFAGELVLGNNPNEFFQVARESARGPAGIRKYVLDASRNAYEQFGETEDFSMGSTKQFITDVDGDGVADWIMYGRGADVDRSINVLRVFSFTSPSTIQSRESGVTILEQKLPDIRLHGLGAKANSKFVDRIERAQVFDLTGDKLKDLVVLLDSGELQFWPNNGTSQEPSWRQGFTFQTDTLALDIALNDLDGDDLMDLLFLYKDGIGALRNVGNASWPAFALQRMSKAEFSISSFSACSKTPCAISFLIADLLGTGADDIFVRGTPDMWYFRRVTQKTASFARGDESKYPHSMKTLSICRPRHPYFKEFADFDGDGDLDVLCVNMLNLTHGTIEYYRNDGLLGWVRLTKTPPSSKAPAATFSISEGLREVKAVAFVDLDKDPDGDLDLIIYGIPAEKGASPTRVLENRDGVFEQVEDDDDPFSDLKGLEEIKTCLRLDRDLTMAKNRETILKVVNCINHSSDLEYSASQLEDLIRSNNLRQEWHNFLSHCEELQDTSISEWDFDILVSDMHKYHFYNETDVQDVGFARFAPNKLHALFDFQPCQPQVFVRSTNVNSRFGAFEPASLDLNWPDKTQAYALMDVDGDGDDEVVVFSSWDMHVFESTDGSTFIDAGVVLPLSKEYGGADSLYALYAIDLDDDGDKDIVMETEHKLPGGDSFTVDTRYAVCINTGRDCASNCAGSRGQCISGSEKDKDGIANFAAYIQGLPNPDLTPGICLCSAQYQGDACEQCIPGRYGESCHQTCPDRSTTRLAPDAYMFPSYPTVEDCVCLSSFVMSNSFECTCPPGAGFNADSDLCEPCAIGEYKSSSGLHACDTCPPGNYTFSAGQSECEPEQCALGYERDTETQTCNPCDQGRYRSDVTEVTCFPCPEDRPLTASTGTIWLSDCLAGPGAVVSENATAAIACSGSEKLRLGADCSHEGLTVETLLVKTHYWRIANTSLDVRACPKAAFCEPAGSPDTRKLASEPSTSDLYCSPHHTGTMCASCINGFALNGSFRCEECTPARRSEDTSKAAIWAVIMLILTVAPAGFVVAGPLMRQRTASRCSLPANHCGCVTHVIKMCMSMRALPNESGSRLQRYMSSAQGKALILLKFAQIVLGLGSIVGIIGSSGSAAEIILNGNFGALLNIFSLGCAVHVNLYVTVIVVTLWPLLFALVLVGAVVLCRLVAPDTTVSRDLSINVFTEIIVLMYPGISGTILSVFVYDSISHYEQDAAGNPDPLPYRILQQDSTIDFDDDLSKAMRVYAGIMVFVYPLGVVALLAAGISFQRTSKGSRTPEQGVRGMLVVAAQVVQHRYKPGRGWYACIELIRRLMLTSGFLLMLLTSFRLASNYLIASSQFFLCVLLYAKPYAREDDELFEIVSQTLLVVLALGVNSLTRVSIATETASVVVWICSIELVAFVGLALWGGYRGAFVSVTGTGHSSSFAEDAKGSTQNPETEKLPSWDLELSEDELDLELSESDYIPVAPPNSPNVQQQVPSSSRTLNAHSFVRQQEEEEEEEAEDTVDDASHVDSDVLSLKAAALTKT